MWALAAPLPSGPGSNPAPDLPTRTSRPPGTPIPTAPGTATTTASPSPDRDGQPQRHPDHGAGRHQLRDWQQPGRAAWSSLAGPAGRVVEPARPPLAANDPNRCQRPRRPRLGVDRAGVAGRAATQLERRRQRRGSARCRQQPGAAGLYALPGPL